MYNRRHDGPCISGVLADEDYDELLHRYCEDPLDPDAMAAGAKAVKLASKHGNVTTSEEAADWMMVASLAERTVSRAAASNAAKRAASLKAAAPPSPKAQRRRRGTAATPHSQKRDSRRLHPWQPEVAPFGEPEPQRATSWHPERTRSQPAAGGDDVPRRTVSWKLDSPEKQLLEFRLQRQPQPSGVRHPRDAQPVAPAHKARRRRTGAKGHAKPAEVGPTPTCSQSAKLETNAAAASEGAVMAAAAASATSALEQAAAEWSLERAELEAQVEGGLLGLGAVLKRVRALSAKVQQWEEAFSREHGAAPTHEEAAGSHTYRSFTRRLRAAEEDLRLAVANFGQTQTSCSPLRSGGGGGGFGSPRPQRARSMTVGATTTANVEQAPASPVPGSRAIAIATRNVVREPMSSEHQELHRSWSFGADPDDAMRRSRSCTF